MTDFVPRFRLGGVAPQPLSVVDWPPYQFYRLVPNDVMLVYTGFTPGISEFTPEGASRAVTTWWDCVDRLMPHKVNWIELEGVPISALLGRERLLDLIEQTQKKVGVPTSSRLESAIAAMHHLGIKTVAIGSRWKDDLNDAVTRYLAACDIRVVGRTSRKQGAAQSLAMSEEEGMRLAIELGKEAMAAAPQADAIYLPGGAWVAIHAIVPLEAEFGKPVFTNVNGTVWNALRRTNVVPPIQGWGKLLAS
ncbi:MAG: hypothetical protein HYY01_07205 [Chloroflexi bacterium]|nr:hypothetical protein [Chloroflexota bacterium]